jgi:hypothetical protein
MKKIISVMLIMMLAVSLVACGGSTSLKGEYTTVMEQKESDGIDPDKLVVNMSVGFLFNESVSITDDKITGSSGVSFEYKVSGDKITLVGQEEVPDITGTVTTGDDGITLVFGDITVELTAK